MARRVTTVEDVPDPKNPPPEPDADPSPLELDREEVLAGWVEELSGQDHAKISIYRIREKDNTPVFIESFGPEQVADDFLRVLRYEYGGGKFRIQAKVKGIIKHQQTVNVEPIPKPQPTGPFGGMDLAGVIRELKGEQHNDTSAILELIRQQQSQFQDLMIRMFESQSARATGPTMGDLMAQLSTAKELFAPAQSKESPMEILMAGIELAREFQSSDKETNFYDVLARSMSSFSGTLDKAMRMSPPPAHPALAAPQQAPRPQAPTTNPSTAGAGEPQPAEPAPAPQHQEPLPAEHPLKQYEGFVQWLVMLAAAEKDPEIYANVVLDQMGDEGARQVFCDDTAWNTVWAAFPVAHPYETWFAELRAVIDEYTSTGDDPGHVDSSSSPAETERAAAGDGAPAGNSERAAGDQANVIDHGPAGEPGKSGAADS